MLLSDYTQEAKELSLRLRLIQDDIIGEVIMHNNEGVKLDDFVEPEKYPYVIGSMQNMSDLTIKAQVVSRMHCCLYMVEGEFFVEDLNSRNGTYLNDKAISSHKKQRLEDGDILKLAAISFKVEIG